MGIVEEDVARVRDSTDIVALISQHLQLRKVGQRWTGLCPFHAEKSPSFSVNAERGLFYCFGCQAKGDSISFVREIEHVDFVGAVEYLARKLGITLRYDTAQQGEGRQDRQKLVDAMEKAVDFYHQRLLSGDDGAAARGYLRSRGLTGEEVRAWKIGWAPDDWDQLSRHLKLPSDILAKSGLGFLNRRQRQQDFFRGRIMFPIYDVNGDPVSFGGRIMPGGQGGKYINLSETRLYNKSKVLYGLDKAKAAAVREDEIVVCEGYTDVIGFDVAGIPRAVATCGTALTEDHIRLMKRFAKRVVLAFDADAAGQAAAERFYEWERAYEVDVRVAALPEGKDPDELARSDPEALVKSVSNAVPFLQFRVDRILDHADLSTVEGRTRAAQTALVAVREHPSELIRHEYTLRIADRCQVDMERLLRSEPLPTAAKAPPPLQRAQAPKRQARGGSSPERDALRVVVSDPATALAYFDETLFSDDGYARAFTVIASATSIHIAMETADPDIADLIGQLSQEETNSTPEQAFMRLVQDAAMRTKDRLNQRARSSGVSEHWLERFTQFGQLLDAVGDHDVQANVRLETAMELLAWLLEEAVVEETPNDE